jgi:hypothetical protein
MNWDASNPYLEKTFNKTDVKLIKSSKVEKLVRKCFQRFPILIDVHVGNGRRPRIRNNNSMLFVLRGNNNKDQFDSDTHPLSGWIVTHRFWQATKDYRFVKFYLKNEEKFFHEPIRTLFYKIVLNSKIPMKPDKIEMFVTIFNNYLSSCFLQFRSAREDILNTRDEFIFELLTEYSLRGTIRMSPPEECIQRINKVLKRHVREYFDRPFNGIEPTPENIAMIQKLQAEFKIIITTNTKAWADEIMGKLGGMVLTSY